MWLRALLIWCVRVLTGCGWQVWGDYEAEDDYREGRLPEVRKILFGASVYRMTLKITLKTRHTPYDDFFRASFLPNQGGAHSENCCFGNYPSRSLHRRVARRFFSFNTLKVVEEIYLGHRPR